MSSLDHEPGPAGPSEVAPVPLEADDAPRGMDRRVIQVFVALLVFVLATSAAPTLHPSQDAFREWVDPFVDGIGLWQGQWELFGPEVDKVNVAVVGVVEFADGERVEWRHPVWRESSPLQKFRHFRLMEFTDGLRLDSNRGAWRAFAEYVVRTNPHPTDPSVRATRVSLWRQFVNIPVPRAPLRPIAEPFVPSEQRLFYSADLGP